MCVVCGWHNLETLVAAAPEPNPNQAHLVNPTITLTRCTGGVRSWDPPTLPPELRSRLARGVRSWDPPTLPPELRSRQARGVRSWDPPTLPPELWSCGTFGTFMTGHHHLHPRRRRRASPSLLERRHFASHPSLERMCARVLVLGFCLVLEVLQGKQLTLLLQKSIPDITHPKGGGAQTHRSLYIDITRGN